MFSTESTMSVRLPIARIIVRGATAPAVAIDRDALERITDVVELPVFTKGIGALALEANRVVVRPGVREHMKDGVAVLAHIDRRLVGEVLTLAGATDIDDPTVSADVRPAVLLDDDRQQAFHRRGNQRRPRA
jgi:hypothetical protein